MQQNVGRRQVSMNDSILMQILHAASSFNGKPERLFSGESYILFVDKIVDATSLQVGRHDA